MMTKTSQAKFHELTIPERREMLQKWSDLDDGTLDDLCGIPGLTSVQADGMIENVVGLYSLPMGIARNFVVNGREVLVPMVIEEPSVVAGASYMAKLVSMNGGFTATSSEPVMIGQMQVLNITDLDVGEKAILGNRKILLEEAAGIDPVLQSLGGGLREITVRQFKKSSIGPFLVVHFLVDVRDAMGANAVNTIVERMSPRIEQITGGKVHLRILSNLADQRLAKATCKISLIDLAFSDFTGEDVRDGIIAAWAFAAVDPYRATTNNKGIMNGIDAVLVATANDWRAIEAGAHAYASRSGKYTSLSKWGKDGRGNLVGELELPLAVGIIGGATRAHPGAHAALKLMGVKTSRDLAEVIVSVGLAQNLAALRALATEGIQRGHMNLHARQVAMTAGAGGETIHRLAAQLVEENQISVERAQQILTEWGNK
jgi:hydroxymethylglutaryl-CoA reductase